MKNNSLWLQRVQPGQSRQQDHRNPFQRDKARVLHSAAFRRLQAKTQVIGVGTSDFHRTRLTHSLEAAQIGQGIVAQIQQKQPELANALALDGILLETLCLAHDIGHPPFGHGGEVALHYMMRHHNGFEGNAQTFRIVTRLEPYTENHGMNLCRRTVLGLVKYPAYIADLMPVLLPPDPPYFRRLKADEWHPPKGLYQDDKSQFDWLLEPLCDQDKKLFSSVSEQGTKLKTQYKSVDCSIMELADDIAYGVHDLEDAITMDIVHRQHFEAFFQCQNDISTDNWFMQGFDSMTNKLFSHQHYQRKDAIGALVNKLITSIHLTKLNEDFVDPILAYNAMISDEAGVVLNLLKQFVYQKVIRQPEIQRVEYKGQQMLMQLFDALVSDPERLLPENTANRWRLASSIASKRRVICDYLAGMTDGYATRMYRNLFVPDTPLHQ